MPTDLNADPRPNGMLRIAIVNRFYPPDPAMTGVAARELADELAAALPGVDVQIVATSARYAGGRPPAETTGRRVHRIRSFYAGRHALLRLLSSLADGYRLADWAARHADIVISLTDPPLLSLFIARAVRQQRRAWIEWTMDIFPDAFAGAGIVGHGNPLYRWLDAIGRRLRPDRMICLGERQHAYLERQRGATIPAFILPCGITAPVEAGIPAWRQASPDKIFLAYAGNLGEAHSPALVARLVERADPARFHFLLAPYGGRAEELRQLVGNPAHVTWRETIPAAELSAVDAHIVSLVGRMTDLCVPSKAVSAICMGRPIIFAGLERADNWRMLGAAGWLIPEWAGETYRDADIDRVLAAVADPAERAGRIAAATRLTRDLHDAERLALQALAGWIGKHQAR